MANEDTKPTPPTARAADGSPLPTPKDRERPGYFNEIAQKEIAASQAASKQPLEGERVRVAVAKGRVERLEQEIEKTRAEIAKKP